MDSLTLVTGFLGGYIVPFILVLSLIVFVHEMGHYLAGRWCGIRVTAFSIGFGPELIGFNDKHGTRWKISAIPLGGYVKYFGDEDVSSKPDMDAVAAMTPAERETSFQGAKLWKRAVSVAAGPFANFVLAIVIFAAIFLVYGKPVTDPVISEVKPESAAAEVGLKSGDLIVALDGTEISTFADIQRYVSVRPGIEMRITVEREGLARDFSVTPRSTEVTDNFGNKMEIGILGIQTTQEAGNFRIETLGPLAAVGEGAVQSWHIVTGTFNYLGNLVTGRMKADQLGGPIRVAQASGEMATLGIAAVLQLAAVLSVSVGLLNLMPVPVLDGGHLVFYAVEAIRGKPVGPVAQEIAFRIGLAMVLSLMVFATWNDIARLIG